MNAKFLHPAGHGRGARGDDERQPCLPAPEATGPACCCPANPVVRVIMPPTEALPHATDLLLCGHHYRASRHALAAAHAAVCELPSWRGSHQQVLVDDVPDPAVAVD